MKKERSISLLSFILVVIGIAFVGRFIVDNVTSNKNINSIYEEEEVTHASYGLRREEKNNAVIVDTSITFEPLVETKKEEPEFQLTSVNYYYAQLDSYGKIIYRAIIDNLDKLKSGNEKIKLSKKLSKALEEKNGSELINKEFQSAWDAIDLDKQDLFYIDISKITFVIEKTTYSTGGVEYELYLAPTDNNVSYTKAIYGSEDNIDTTLEQVKAARDEIIGNMQNMNIYQKIKYAHDYIIDNFDYSNESETGYDIYGGLVGKKGVCEAYAESFKYILDEVGIPCILVCGTAKNSEGVEEKHEWNYVQLEGKWYAVDATWDDPIVKGRGRLSEEQKHAYFMVGSNSINKDHTVSGYISGTGMEFSYPELEKYNYKN